MHTTRRTGGHRTIFEYCNGLLKRGHTVSICALGFPHDHTWFPLKAKVVYSSRGRYLNFYNNLAGQLGLPAVDETRMLTNLVPQCDVAVGTFFQTATAVARADTCKHKAYFAQHFDPLLLDSPYEQHWALSTYHLGMPIAVNSTWLQQRIKQETGAVCPVIPPGINLRIFRPRGDVAHKHRLRILALSKPWVKWKGAEDLLSALKLVTENRSDFELVTFGVQKPSINGLNVPHRHIHAPSDDELARLYSSADIVVSPSWYESWPLPPLEAMACGTAVITTRPGTEDYARHMQNAFVVPARNPATLAAGLLRLMDEDSLRRRLGEAATKSVRGFSWETAVSRMEAFLREVVDD